MGLSAAAYGDFQGLGVCGIYNQQRRHVADSFTVRITRADLFGTFRGFLRLIHQTGKRLTLL